MAAYKIASYSHLLWCMDRCCHYCMMEMFGKQTMFGQTKTVHSAINRHRVQVYKTGQHPTNLSADIITPTLHALAHTLTFVLYIYT